MIAHLSGTLLRRNQDEQRVILDVGGVGYEVLLPTFVMRALEDKQEGDRIELEIYYHVSERQPRPTLIGFNRPHERAFFEKLIQVEDIGPMKAARALTLSVSTIARAIEDDDIATLRRLDGIGERTARKIVATLRGRLAAEALLRDEGFAVPSKPVEADAAEEAVEALQRLGYTRLEARAAVEAAVGRWPDLRTTEDLIQEVFRAQRA